MKEAMGSRGKADRIAGPDEVRAAVSLLSEAQLFKLGELAEMFAYRLGRRAGSPGEDDLLQDAITRILDGRRKWKPGKVDLVGLIAGTLRSITSEILEQRKHQPRTILECDLPQLEPNGQEITLVQMTADHRPNIEHELMVSEQTTADQLLDRIEALFSYDALAGLILSEWIRGSSGTEIMGAMGLNRQEYDTAVRRIYRTVREHWPEGMPDVH
jgi:DNA-directed RNA polymerase specialized sigma24 family protein